MIFVTHQNDTRQMMGRLRQQCNCADVIYPCQLVMCAQMVASNLAVFTGNDKNIIGGFKMR